MHVHMVPLTVFSADYYNTVKEYKIIKIVYGMCEDQRSALLVQGVKKILNTILMKGTDGKLCGEKLLDAECRCV